MITKAGIIYKDEDGNVEGGVTFFFTPGNDIVLYQEWEYRCAGNTGGLVNPDPIGSDGLLEYLMGSWLGQREDKFYELDGDSIVADYR
jgi:hypothetical protein